jgi:hypothetical protein
MKYTNKKQKEGNKIKIETISQNIDTYLTRCCMKSVSHLRDMGRSLLGGDPCRGALEVPTLFTDVDDPRLLGPEIK